MAMEREIYDASAREGPCPMERCLRGDPCPRAWSVADPKEIVREAAEYLKEQAKD